MPSLYIMLEQDVPGLNVHVDGRALSKYEQELDRIARQLSVPALMDFFSMDPEEAAEIMADNGGDPSSVEIEEEQWHEASAGLASVRALRDYTTREPDSLPNPAGVQADLDEFEGVLQAAQERGVRWHLAVDY